MRNMRTAKLQHRKYAKELMRLKKLGTIFLMNGMLNLISIPAKNSAMKAVSKLSKTKSKFKRLLSAMRKAEKKIDPVLNVFRDQVLYLKHNLNAQAIASLKSELNTLEGDIGRLIKEMQRSIDEANAFIKELKKS